MNQLLLSVVIPAYNAETSITGTVQSIYREFQMAIPYEIIVVENGATDQTTQVVEKLAVQMPCVKLYHSEKGVSNARNTGIANAAGKWLMFVDADDELHLGCGKRIIDIMQNSEADLCLFGHMNGKETRRVCEKTVKILNRQEYNFWKHRLAICRCGQNYSSDNELLMQVFGLNRS